MKQRIITGVVLGGLLLTLILRGSYELIAIVVLGAASFAYIEFDRMFFDASSLWRRLRMVVLVCLTILAIQAQPQLGWFALWFSFIFLVIFQILENRKSENFSKTVHELCVQGLGYLYSLALLGFLLPIVKYLPHGHYYLLLLFLIIFCGDTAAYFVGQQMGRHKLVPVLSPKKTIEGAIGGLVVATLVPLVWAQLFLPGSMDVLHLTKLMGFAFVASILAQFSDLFESFLKRSRSQKDSGQVFPGHGGLLDRIDGLALVAPVFYFYISRVLH